MKESIRRWWRFATYCSVIGIFFGAVWRSSGSPWWVSALGGVGAAIVVAVGSIYQARHGWRRPSALESYTPSDHLIISNENVTDARVIGRVSLVPDERLTETIEDMAIVPDLKHEADGWKIMNFRLCPRTQVDTRPIEEIFKRGSQ